MPNLVVPALRPGNHSCVLHVNRFPREASYRKNIVLDALDGSVNHGAALRTAESTLKQQIKSRKEVDCYYAIACGIVLVAVINRRSGRNPLLPRSTETYDAPQKARPV
jgi:hypothetical protein